MKVICENCGLVFDGMNAAACYLHEYECIPNDNTPTGALRVDAQKIGNKWNAVVTRDRPIYLTDDHTTKEAALAAAAEFLALLE